MAELSKECVITALCYIENRPISSLVLKKARKECPNLF
jgi:hypothetical protein